MRYINLDDAIKEIDKGELLIGDNATWAKELLSNLQTVDIKEPIRGIWHLETDEECPDPRFKLVICSVCKEPSGDSSKFCPHCGAVMTSISTEGTKFS